MGKCKYTEDYRRKHVLEEKKAQGEITEDEEKELEYLIQHFNYMLHRFRP